MPPPKMTATVLSLTAPWLPETPPDIDPSLIRSPSIPNILSPTSPLYFTLILPLAREKDTLYPATHLQMAYFYQGTGETFSHTVLTNKDLVRSEAAEEPNTFIVEVPPESILRAKVNHGESPKAEVRFRAWRNEKLLGLWTVGNIDNLGLEGFKSLPVHLRRVEQWTKDVTATTEPDE